MPTRAISSARRSTSSGPDSAHLDVGRAVSRRAPCVVHPCRVDRSSALRALARTQATQRARQRPLDARVARVSRAVAQLGGITSQVVELLVPLGVLHVLVAVGAEPLVHRTVVVVLAGLDDDPWAVEFGGRI